MKSFQIYSIRISEWKTIFGVSTYLKGGKLRYNCTIIDLYDRSVVIINLFLCSEKSLSSMLQWRNSLTVGTTKLDLTPITKV